MGKNIYKETTNRLGTLLFLLVLATGLISCAGTSDINVGVAETVITPDDPTGLPMSGFDRGGNTSEGVHDDLYARSIVVEDADGNSVALVTVAVIRISEEMGDLVRGEIEQATGIPGENVIISSTHTHSAPTPRAFDEILTDRMVESVVTAWENREPGRIGVGTTEVHGLGIKRDALDQGGVHPDPEVGVIKVEDARGRLLGLFFNHGAHPATLDLHNLLLTEDWAYFSIAGIKEQIGDHAIVGYYQGAEGDINTGYNALFSAVGSNMYGARSFEQAAWKGQLMADAVVDILPQIQTRGDIEVRAAYDRVDLPRRTTYPWTHEEALEWQREASERLAEMEERLPTEYPTNREEADRWQREAREMAVRGELDVRNMVGPRQLDAYRADMWAADQAVRMAQRIEELPDDPEPINAPMQAVRLGDAVFVTFPNEVYSEIGVAVKQQSPFETTHIIGVAGDMGGYIPTAADHLERGYVSNGTPYAPETEQVLIDSSLDLIQRVSQ